MLKHDNAKSAKQLPYRPDMPVYEEAAPLGKTHYNREGTLPTMCQKELKSHANPKANSAREVAADQVLVIIRT